jgi:hypothetical protein
MRMVDFFLCSFRPRRGQTVPRLLGQRLSHHNAAVGVQRGDAGAAQEQQHSMVNLPSLLYLAHPQFPQLLSRVMLLLFNGLFLLLLFLLVVAYLRCRLGPGLSRKDQFRRIRFVPAANGKPALGDAEAQKSSAMGGGPGRGCSSSPALAVRTNLALGTVSASSMSSTPLLVSGGQPNSQQQQCQSYGYG